MPGRRGICQSISRAYPGHIPGISRAYPETCPRAGRRELAAATPATIPGRARGPRAGLPDPAPYAPGNSAPGLWNVGRVQGFPYQVSPVSRKSLISLGTLFPVIDITGNRAVAPGPRERVPCPWIWHATRAPRPPGPQKPPALAQRWQRPDFVQTITAKTVFIFPDLGPDPGP
jgi:hypothetical protein